MVPTPDLVDGKDYYITAGTEYGEESYVWVGQTKMRANLMAKTYEANLELKNPPTAISKGSAALFTVEAFITDPAESIEFGVFQPLGYNDLFHIGHVTYDIGNAFACSDPKFWTTKYLKSPSGLSVVNASLSYPLLINREADRNVALEKNKITFRIPIHVVNIDTVEVGISRSMAFGLKIGESKLWTALHDIQIDPFSPPGAVGSISIVSNDLLNNVTANEGVLAGNAALFQVVVSVPSGWADFSITMEGNLAEGIYPMGAKVVRSGTIGYIPPEWTVRSRDGNTLAIAYSNVQNPSPNPTEVVLELAFSTEANVTAENAYSVTAVIGGESLTFNFDVKQNNNPEAIVVTAEEFGWNSDLHQSSQLGLDLRITVPPAAGDPSLHFEAVPDFENTAVSIRICSVRVNRIGEGLPCLFHQQYENAASYNKSDPDRPFHDFGVLPIGQTCPVRYPDGGSGANQFSAQVIYELAAQESITTGDPYKVSGGLKIGESTIWVSSREYTLNSATLEGLAIEGAIAGQEVTPFFTSYPIVSVQDRADPVLSGSEIFFVQYLIKIQPLTRGDYIFKVLPPSDIKVCRMYITHIGSNLPCAQVPEPTLTEFENVIVEYAEGDQILAHDFGEPGTITFKGLTNWGRDPMVPDLTPDADAIQVKVFYQATESIAASNASISHTLTPGTAADDITGTHILEFSGTPMNRNVTTIPTMRLESVIGDNTTIYKHASKIMHIRVPIPDNFFGDLWLDVIHDNSEAGRIVDFCQIALIEVGENMPCVRIQDELNATYIADPPSLVTVVEEEEIHAGIQVKIPGVCFMKSSSLEEASLLTFLVAFRVRDSTADNEVINMKIVAKSENTDESTHSILNLPLTVVTPVDGDIPVDEVKVDDVKIGLDDASQPEIAIRTGEKLWVPFFISFPPEKTLNMEASLLLPSDEGKAVFHASDIKFGESEGKNILCTGANALPMDLRRSYETNFEQTPNITTFMQMDSVTTKLGIIQNSGVSLRQGHHNTTDDQFSIQVEVQLSDHILAESDATFDIYFAIKFGTIIVVANQKLKVVRNLNRAEEIGQIMIEGNQTQIGKVFDANDTISVETLIFHTNESQAEGYPTKIRVITPRYLAFTVSDTISTNYTLNHSSEEVTVVPDTAVNGSAHGWFDIIFPQGITYADIISLNFTLTADPEQSRSPGTGDEASAIIVTPLCIQNQIDNHPAEANSTTQCGQFVAFDVTVSAPECFDPVPISFECQVRASSMKSNSTNPFHAIGTSQVWSPPIRTGNGWEEYLEFDFLIVTRINRLVFQVPGGGNFRDVVKIRIQSSNVPTFFTDIKELSFVPGQNIDFDVAIQARYMRILFVELSPLDASEKSIGINNVQWYGCRPKGFIPDESMCQPNPTWVSTDRTQYRHFAYASGENIVYVCDRNPHLHDLVCYSSDRTLGGNTWTELPRYIGYIEGYSASTGRVYFRGKGSHTGLLSSLDGSVVQLTDVLPPDIELPKVVPGEGATEFTDVSWPSGSPSGTFEGLVMDNELILQWSSCCT